MAELISSNSTPSALHSSPSRKRTRDSNLAAATAAAAFKANYQPISRSTSDYMHSSCRTAAALATDESSTFVAMEASSTSAAVPLTQARKTIRSHGVNGSAPSSSSSSATEIIINGAKNGHSYGDVIDQQNEYVVSDLNKIKIDTNPQNEHTFFRLQFNFLTRNTLDFSFYLYCAPLFTRNPILHFTFSLISNDLEHTYSHSTQRRFIRDHTLLNSKQMTWNRFEFLLWYMYFVYVSVAFCAFIAVKCQGSRAHHFIDGQSAKITQFGWTIVANEFKNF